LIPKFSLLSVVFHNLAVAAAIDGITQLLGVDGGKCLKVVKVAAVVTIAAEAVAALLQELDAERGSENKTVISLHTSV
jgi:hypothetical protein